MWNRLAERFDLVTVDLPNHGGSDAASDVITVDEHAAFLGEIPDHFELERPHFVGPDIGTPSVLRFLTDRPERIASVVGGDAGTVSPVEGELTFRLLVNSRLFRLATRSLGRQLGSRFHARSANCRQPGWLLGPSGGCRCLPAMAREWHETQFDRQQSSSGATPNRRIAAGQSGGPGIRTLENGHPS